MLGDALATAAEAPGAGWYWDTTAAHPRVPRSAVVRLPRGDAPAPSLEEVVIGPTSDPSGQRNLFGALRRVMGKCGYSSVKEFQKAELILTGVPDFDLIGDAGSPQGELGHVIFGARSTRISHLDA